MASLQNAQIDQSYPGLIKTETNGAIGAGTTKITDGQGNQTGMQFFLSGNTGELGMEAASLPAFYTKNNALTKANYPMGTGSSAIKFLDAGGQDLAEIKLDNYGSMYYKNINGDQGEGHVFQSAANNGATTPAKIRMDTYNSVNNSDNWYLGYQQSVNALTINGQDLTIGREDAADLTVTLPGGGGAAGLVAGTGPDSMASAATLTTTAAIASGDQSIAIGNEAEAVGFGTTAIGEGATANGNFSAAYGRDAIAANGAVAIGNDSRASGTLNPIAIGYSSRASSAGSVALGANVTAAIQDTVSVKALEVQTDSTPTAGGIIMSDAGGTDRRINIDAAGGLQIDSTPVGGGGGAAGLVNGTGADTLVSAASLTTTPAVATDTGSIALGEGASSTGLASIAIGSGAVSSGTYYGISIGRNSTGGAGTAVGWGTQCHASSRSSAFGAEADALGSGSTAIGGAANASGGNSVSIGESSSATAAGATALGAFVDATIANTASVKELEVQTVGGGIILYSANGTGYKVTVTDGGLLTTTAI